MKRQRPVTSCLQCRRRRVRCDRVHPSCTRCLANHVQCEYGESASIGSASASASASASIAAPPTQNQRLESRPQQPEQKQSREQGNLYLSHGGRSVYAGSTFWANSLPSEVQDSGPLGFTAHPSPFPKWTPRTDESSQWPRRFTGAGSPYDRCKLCGARYSMGCLLSLLPPQGICEKLCEIFFATVFPLIPILHVRSFSEDFQQLWKSIDPVNPHNSETSIFLRRKPGFLCLLSSILFAALASSSPKRRIGALGENAQLVDTGDMYFLTTVSATLNGFPRQPSVYSLAAFIFSQSQFVREEEFSDAPEFISTAFRIALGMGLHRKVAHPGLSMAEIETRRRIWWYILHLDVMSSTSSGLSPLFVDEKMTNADFISQYDPPEWNSVNLQPEIDTRYLVASQRYEVTTKTRKILCCHFEDYFDTLTAVAEVEQDLHKVVRSTNALTDELILSANRAAEQQPSVASGSSADYLNLAATMARPFDRVWTLRPDPNDTEVVGFSAWSALLLHLMVHKAYCALYVPLFKNPAMASYEIIRSSAVKHAQAFVQLFIRVCNDSISEPYHWMYPGTYQPLQSVSLLLADLLQHPHSDHAELSHSLVDSIFELYKVDEGFVSQDDPPNRFLSTSSRDAWTLLLHTRRRALEQLGIDHHVLTPSSIVSSDTCICGQHISTREQSKTAAAAAAAVVVLPDNEQVQEQVHNEIEIPPHFAQLTPGDGLAVANSFDWHEWDNMLGGSLGIIA